MWNFVGLSASPAISRSSDYVAHSPWYLLRSIYSEAGITIEFVARKRAQTPSWFVIFDA